MTTATLTPETNKGTDVPPRPAVSHYSHPVDIITSRDGNVFRAEIAPGHVGTGPTELDAALAVARKALDHVNDVKCVISCRSSRSGTGLYVATQRIPRKA